MDSYDEEILNLWKLLIQNEVKFIVVGGFAVNMHGISRFTADLDLWIKDTPENRKHLRNSLFQANMGDIEAIETTQFIPDWTSLNLPSGFELDIMTFMKGFPQERFDDSYDHATVADVHGVPVRFFHINQLIEAKKAVARPQDILDAAALKKITKAH
ncbi:MAG: hypothetical protein SH857_14395 [Chitinophagales bacterium]|nr:hypothetical protein [Chitinophagales bacterium]